MNIRCIIHCSGAMPEMQCKYTDPHFRELFQETVWQTDGEKEFTTQCQFKNDKGNQGMIVP